MSTPPVCYQAGKFPPKDLDWTKLIPLIGPASAGLARYDGLLSAIPNADILLSPLTTQEAILSSKIEGTHVTMGEVLEIEAGGESEEISQPKREDAEEVLNYRKAMRTCVAEMEQRPLSQQVLRAAHAIRAVDFIFKAPIFTAPQFTNYSGIPKRTTGRILKILRNTGLLAPLRLEEGVVPECLLFES